MWVWMVDLWWTGVPSRVYFTSSPKSSGILISFPMTCHCNDNDRPCKGFFQATTYAYWFLQFHASSVLLSVTELVGVEYRRPVAVFFQMFFSIGILILPLLAYFISNWRWLQVAITAPYLCFLVYYWWGSVYSYCFKVSESQMVFYFLFVYCIVWILLPGLFLSHHDGSSPRTSPVKLWRSHRKWPKRTRKRSRKTLRWGRNAAS